MANLVIKNKNANNSSLTFDINSGSDWKIENNAGTLKIKANNVDQLTIHDNKALSMNRKADTTIGNYSMAEGYETSAIAMASHAEGSTTTAEGERSHAEGYQSIAKGNQSHAEGNTTTSEGVNSHSEGYNTIAKGDSSHAEGYFTTAKGHSSHAEGYFTTAEGDSSHAEGNSTIAIGHDSHVEGCGTTASGLDSHAEGFKTIAEGDYSHAEGYQTTASGEVSHTEGWNTTAEGKYSHAEGWNTKASGNYSHVQGQYNIEDTENKYAHIVGNGDSNFRSNAHTLDWDGNAWYKGNINTSENFYTESTTNGYFLVDKKGFSYPGVYDNGTNLWIGSTKSATTHHTGYTYISSGHNGQTDDTAAGNKSIYIAIPNAENTNSTNQLIFHQGYLDVGCATDGILAVEHGGTGKNTHTSNSVLVGNSTNALKNISSNNGAFYATAADKEPKFGTLPIAQGGTAATTVEQARQNINYIGMNPIEKDKDTHSNWSVLGTGVAYFNELILNDQPYSHGIVNSQTNGGNVVTQLFLDVNGRGYIRGADSNGFSTWAKILTNRDTVTVAQGGTGKNTHTSNSVLVGNGTSAIKNIASASGAFYATSANGEPKFGTLPVAQGGTGATSFTSGQALIGAGTGAVTTRAITNNTSKTAVTASTNLITANTLYYHSGNSNLTTVGTITSGTWHGSTIGVSYGGTGKDTHTSNAVLTGNGTSAVKNVATANGAFYATAANGAAKFGTLPIAQGGTGATTRPTAMNNLMYIEPPTKTTDTGVFWSDAGYGLAYSNDSNTMTKPSGVDYLWVQNIVLQDYNLIRQLGFAGESNSIYTRKGNKTDGMGEWYKLLTTAATVTVAQGGTGATSFTSGQALIGAGTGAITTRAITNNTSATAVSASTNLITANTLYYHKGNSNIVTVGTISSGTWHGTDIGVSYGGTGASTAEGAQYNLLKDLPTSTSDITDATIMAFKYASPSSTAGVLYTRTADYLWTYIRGKGDNRYLKLTGGTLSGTLTVNEGADAASIVRCSDGTNKISLQVSGSDNKGIYDDNNSQWMIYRPDGTTIASKTTRMQGGVAFTGAHGTGEPGSSTPGYGVTGAVYFRHS